MCAINTPSAVSMATAPNPRGVDGRRVNPTPVVGGAFSAPPTEKWQLLQKIMILKSPNFVTFPIYL